MTKIGIFVSSRKWFSTFAANVSLGHLLFAMPTLNFLREFAKLERFDIPIAFADFFCTFAQGLVLLVSVVLQPPHQLILVKIGDHLVSILIVLDLCLLHSA